MINLEIKLLAKIVATMPATHDNRIAHKMSNVMNIFNLESKDPNVGKENKHGRHTQSELKQNKLLM
jgi:hypothetical protein